MLDPMYHAFRKPPSTRRWRSLLILMLKPSKRCAIGSTRDGKKSASKGKESIGYLVEMGLGKTATTLADFVRAWKDGLVDGLAVIAPFSLLDNWEEEARIWVPESVGLSVATWPDVPERDHTPWMWVLNYEALSVGHAKGNTVRLNYYTIILTH